MTRGNQREQDRAKAQKKSQKGAKKTDLNGQSLKNKKENDADIMRKKQEAAAAKRAADAAGNSNK